MRIQLPATLHLMPDVRPTEYRASPIDPYAQPQVGGLVWRGEAGLQQVCSLHAGVVHCPDIRGILQKLSRHRSRSKRMVVVLEDAEYHYTVLLAPLLRKHRKVLTLALCATIQPEPGAIERVWILMLPGVEIRVFLGMKSACLHGSKRQTAALTAMT